VGWEKVGECETRVCGQDRTVCLVDNMIQAGSREGGPVGQAEDKVDLNKVHLKVKQIRRGMEEDRQSMGVSDMECMDVQGGEEEIQVALKGLRGFEGVECPAMRGWPRFMALLGSRLRIL